MSVKVKFEITINESDFDKMLDSLTTNNTVDLDFLSKKKAMVINWSRKKQPIYGSGKHPIMWELSDGECDLQVIY